MSETDNNQTISNSRGGARPGSGRKRKAEKNVTAIEAAEKQIRDRLPDVVGYMLELAQGVTVQEEGKDGELKIYTRPPDYKAAAYLIDRIMGKATERRIVELDRPLDELTDDELRAIAES